MSKALRSARPRITVHDVTRHPMPCRTGAKGRKVELMDREEKA